jgi:hypothetical protein
MNGKHRKKAGLTARWHPDKKEVSQYIQKGQVTASVVGNFAGMHLGTLFIAE